MKVKEINPGDLVSLRTKDKSWKGNVLESYDPEIVLLKLGSGYNIGIREREILDMKVVEKAQERKVPEIEAKENKKLRNVAMIITGGTISSRLDPKSGGVISTDAKEILNIAPEISKICNVVKIEKPFMKWSENMGFIDWKGLAGVCEELLNDSEIDGVIITHGTDFLHYTSAALSFFLKNLNKPVALTYSQRSIDRASTDAALNLICAAKYAVSDIAEVALIGHKDENDGVCLAMPGTKVRKLHTSRRDAFKIVNGEPIAEISKEGMKILKEFNARDDSRKVKPDAKYSDKIASIKITPGQDPSIIEFYKDLGYGGLILEITGIGQVPAQDAKFNWLPKIKKAIDGGMIICATAQTIFGRLNPNVYTAGRDLQKTGIVFLKDMLSETALVKLGWVLGHKTWAADRDKVEEKMLENFSGELNECIKE
ncbi:Glu-tRNA(Gln) amidotransferase subunit GatD [archaeon]|jgi:glutamyl-tRNA(Gln) amidotransferase subunit D|nr:Glu-tRNA(Gln) amidotransferase subunit GatD [archaeon]MBT3577366.1 Glu-tRNA(Gln) amidotransferase subunit GatD [archaeon]MBT6820391.1 Glu-tRNA(Gln) amidotransferase subunit GatD [archaeon]MBT7025205.1 Glu-tRNA(Gln) amidotransferase subunit GatD [archaeon]MBT7238800.1 Glu-tRNA(Gln) amidotransferase subunit GatD [archaeon]